MRNSKTPIIFFGITILLTSVLFGAENKKGSPLNATAFTFADKPIHPGAIWEFEVWLSDDGLPRIKTIDLESCVTSNKNFRPPITRKDGFLQCTDEDVIPQKDYSWFAYKHLGVTSDGTHVLVTESGGGGGTAIIETIFLVRFDTEDYFEWTKDSQRPTNEQRTVLKCVGQIVLGDRDDASVELKGDTLTIGKSRYREKDATYQIP